MLDLNAIKARSIDPCSIVTVEPAEVDEYYANFASVRIQPPNTHERHSALVLADQEGEVPAFANFIAHAPTDIAALIAEVERLRAILEWNQ